jgi:hypothetical protein
MPNRILKDSICTSDNLDKLMPEQEVFWYRLIVQCDDYGRMDARPAILRAKCYPLKIDQVPEATIAHWLQVLHDAELIEVYQIDAKPYLQIRTWEKHQQIRAKRSKYPPMPTSDIIGNQAISDDSICPRNPIQSNLNPNTPTATPEPEPVLSPEARAIRNAYDACGIMLSKTHRDEHLKTIAKNGLPAWQLGFAIALEKGKQNMPLYVARCAESVHIGETRGNGQTPPVDNEMDWDADPQMANYRKAKHAKS